ncbi:hypothetical protein BN1708_000598 [Verticillium longisporum]|uniref:Developmental regulatory protein wetA n=1 Tax=Verticillium longisporum TaxID=100787 RepID=A0A0G4LXJ9_VERLO|nr:hypothetical protein BN1708_000598 [Verticillium longisporum]
MTVPVSHYERPGSSGTGPHVKSEYDDLGYSAVQFSVDSLDADVVNFEAGKDGYHGGSTAAHNEAMDWGSAMPADDLRFDDFLDLDSMPHTGDEWPDQPDSLFFDMPALDGSTSTTSVSGDFDDLLSCHSQQQHNHQHHLHQHHQHHQLLLQVPPVEARTSTTAGPAATSCMAAGSGVGSASGGSGAIRFPSAHQEDCGPAAEVTDVTAHIRPGKSQPSPAIARGGVGLGLGLGLGLGRGGGGGGAGGRVPGGQRKTPSTYPDTALGLGGTEAISDSELLRLEGISLKASPTRVPPLGHVSHSQPPTPLLHQGQGPATSKPTPATTTTTTSSSTAAALPMLLRIYARARASLLRRSPVVGKTPSTYPDTALGLGGTESISDSELLRLEGISLKASPSRVPPLGHVSHSQPPTPLLHQGQGPATSKPTPATATTTTSSSTAAATTGSRSFFKAVASKIQKAATVRSKPSFSRTTINTTERDSSTMSTLSIDRPISPAISPRKAFKLRPDQQQMGIPDGSHPQQQRLPISLPNSATIPQGLSNPFCNGFVEDPFAFDPSVASGPSPAVYKRQAPHTPIDTPVLEDDKSTMYFQQPIHPHQGGIAQANKAAWPLPSSSAHADSHGNMAWSNSFAQSDGLDTTQWWDGPVDLNDASSQFQAQNARNATYNLALHTQQAAGGAGRDMAYEYHNQGQQQQHMPTAGNPHEMSGLMIQMSQANRSFFIVAGCPQLQHQMPPQPQTERRPRMPRAPSAGARHMTTPMRRQRPSSANRNRARDSSSASPTPNGRSRNSSGSSNAGGPVIGASVKKRRSFQTPAGGRPGHPRTPSGGSSGALGLGIGMGDGGGGGGGFVNFTPSDHTLLMTGVAPSGSSKTKARREKEALEKRRRMSEAALKAVAAAGGDIDKLVEEGFVF